MRKFKLIKKYPGSGEVGDMVAFISNFLGDQTVYDGHGKTPTRNEVFNFPEYWEEIIEVPEYVEALENSFGGQFIKGKIYKVKKRIGQSYMIEEDSKGSKTNGWNIGYFKPSTKEAFDKQKEIIICGHKVEKNDKNDPITYKIGCKIIGRDELRVIRGMMVRNKFQTASFDGYAIHLSEIEQILEM